MIKAQKLQLAQQSNYSALKWVLVALPILLVSILWLTDTVKVGQLVTEVYQVKLLSWLESPYTYFYLHIFTFVPVFALSFDKNVHYYTEWKYLLPAIAIVGGIFIAWDVFFAAQEVWGFNEKYLSGWFAFGLPVEEWLFFFTVPFACVFIYECLNFYIKQDVLAPIEQPLTISLITIFLLVGFAFWGNIYTCTTFLLSGFFLLYHYLFLDGRYRGRFYLSYLVSWLPFMLVNGVLTGGYTNEPIVIYNPEEFLGIRLTSVPLDDSVYSFLLLFGTVTLFEYFRKRT
ncbi:MAG: lycopene cyclase domain-containing protein [Bacteroidota bacterium]